MYQNLEVDMWISSYHVETVSGYGSAARCANQSHYGAQQIVNIIITLGWCKCRGLSGRQWLDTRTRAAVTLITATTTSQQPVPQEFVRLQTLARPGQCGTHGLIALCRNTVANSSCLAIKYIRYISDVSGLLRQENILSECF